MKYEVLTRGQQNDQARKRILDAFEQARGKTAVAASLLGVHKTTLLRAIRRLNLSREISERWPSLVREAFALISDSNGA